MCEKQALSITSFPILKKQNSIPVPHAVDGRDITKHTIPFQNCRTDHSDSHNWSDGPPVTALINWCANSAVVLYGSMRLLYEHGHSDADRTVELILQ